MSLLEIINNPDKKNEIKNPVPNIVQDMSAFTDFLPSTPKPSTAVTTAPVKKTKTSAKKQPKVQTNKPEPKVEKNEPVKQVVKPEPKEKKTIKEVKPTSKKEIPPMIAPQNILYPYIKYLIEDKTTGSTIIFAEDEYEGYGLTDHYTEDIIKELIASKKLHLRVFKALEHQKARTKKNAEVFTPSHICKQMIDWMEVPSDWKKFVQATWLEITCGEAPFITSRYDATTGEPIKLEDRFGVLDRKMQAVNDNVHEMRDWMKWARIALATTYGYEFQGDNLFIARCNVMLCFISYYKQKWNELPDSEKIRSIIEIVVWNFWQMDGLTDTIPFSTILTKIVDWKQPKDSDKRIFDFRNIKWE